MGAFPPSGVTRAVKWILSCRKRIPLGVTHFHFVILQLNFLYRDLYLRNTFSTFHLCLSCSQYIFLALSFYLSLSMSIMYMYIYISTLGSPYIWGRSCESTVASKRLFASFLPLCVSFPLVDPNEVEYILSVPKFIANLYCICLSINLLNTSVYIHILYKYINKLKSYKLCLLWKTLILKSIDQVE